MKYTENELINMAAPISQSEDAKCKNAISMVRDAMKNLNYTDDGKDIRTYKEGSYSYALDLRQKNTDKKITLLVQGSYANKTNIPSESDVDVAVILESTFVPKYRDGVTGKNYGFSEGTFSAEELKDEVLNALKIYFNNDGVERHDKSIKIIGNTYRVNADVVPAYRHRDYTNDFLINENNYVGGIEIRPDSGGRIINYPEQHIRNDIEKNNISKYNFKKCVRIIKNMRIDMISHGYNVPLQLSSFGLESLLWNVRESAYTKYSSVLRYTFDEVIDFLKNDYSNFPNYKEANGIKQLFVDTTVMDSYKKFITDLSNYYEYDI